MSLHANHAMAPGAMHSASSVSVAPAAATATTNTVTNASSSVHTTETDQPSAPAAPVIKVPTAQTIAKLADTVDDLFSGCKEIVLHFNMGIYNGLDQLTHTGPETYTNRVVERMHAIDMLCDQMILDLGPGAELEAIFAPSALEASTLATSGSAPTTHVPPQPQPPTQSGTTAAAAADDDDDAMQIDPDPSSSTTNRRSADAASRQRDAQKWATDFLLSVFEADALAVMGQGTQGVLTAPPSPTVAAGGGVQEVGSVDGGASGADDTLGDRVEDELMAMLVD